MKIFSRDNTLPALPVPDLADTCETVLELTAPLVDESVFSATCAAVRDFSRLDGAGRLLQALLCEHKASMAGNASWLRPFWDDMYLAWRDPLPINLNYCFRFAAERWGGEEALPRLVRALAETARLLRSGELVSEETPAGPLSMDQVRSCLYTRIPAEGSDTLLMVDPAAPLTAAVTCDGRWFIMPLEHADGALAGEEELSGAFAAIRRTAALPNIAPPLAAMTAAPRAEATSLRATLLQDMRNRLSLAAVEKSLFVICLDPPHRSDEGFLRSLLCGPAGSRWFDKSLQLVCSANGGLGANFEHAGCDAHIWLYLLGLCDKSIRNRTDASRSSRDTLPFRELRWNIDEALAARLDDAAQDYFDRANTVDLCCKDFADYSRSRVKTLGTSPDAFLQIAFQAAQCRVFGHLRSSYEAVSVRGFAEGRTECARGSTYAAGVLAKALRSISAETLRSSVAANELLLGYYRSAENAHKANVARCQRGLGAERHMTGLAVMHTLHAAELGLGEPPAIFRDPGWLTVKHDALSTSSVSAPFIRFFGFGPVVQDGYGVGYAPGPDATGLVVTAFRSKAEPAGDFLAAFAASAKIIADLLYKSLPESRPVTRSGAPSPTLSGGTV